MWLVVFWYWIICSLVGGYESFGVPEDGGGMFF
jgi:hypothetical protein